jgi:transcriptional regulator with XRE-family HTH domain
MTTNNIQKIRERLGLSQRDFADMIGVWQSAISHYENERNNVSPDVARRMIDVAAKRGIHITFDEIYATPEVEE